MKGTKYLDEAIDISKIEGGRRRYDYFRNHIFFCAFLLQGILMKVAVENNEKH